MKNIFLFGECMIELMTASQEKSSSTIKQSFAGDVFNTAVYLKRTFSDIKVNLVTAVGKDNFSQKMVQYFEDEQIGTDLVFQSETKIPGLYSIQLDDKGERSFTYWRNDSAARQVMQHIDDQAISQLSEGDMFFFSGISLAVVEPEARADFWSMIEKLKSADVKIVFDPNYRARMWDTPGQAKEQFELAFSAADVLLPGVDDFEQLYGMTTSQEVYDFCKPYQFDELIIKNGEMGIICYLGDLAYEFFITPVDNVVDTTSAGDSFNGVYLGARANGLSLSEAIELASKSAAFVIQHHGAIVEPNAYQAFITDLLN
ncbi:sugar kinase [Colwellia sp. 1_MG-2023]|uniref:sugar kinase n=1 Tax=unclassified Colwellia TaxID=196834 RepID=UPI001C0A596A|nr:MULTISPECIES: sugar kinase [unclassified Colwellia]MBU2924428.1 sugar kinase [Colwellia sp. C2M11]MDO6653088.1 sugar kinase [Colwellia sp. 3_MG-2023]MDO6665925.1 sugar kinase [Colwellia sp. 2_MG-2023]MDO6690298.1 sugar kinase [Colwellia sp. 1_MG-2023]